MKPVVKPLGIMRMDDDKSGVERAKRLIQDKLETDEHYRAALFDLKRRGFWMSSLKTRGETLPAMSVP